VQTELTVGCSTECVMLSLNNVDFRATSSLVSWAEVVFTWAFADNTDSFKYLEWRAEAGPNPSLSVWSGEALASLAGQFQIDEMWEFIYHHSRSHYHGEIDPCWCSLLSIRLTIQYCHNFNSILYHVTIFFMFFPWCFSNIKLFISTCMYKLDRFYVL
jgi:hypothetical protein